MSDKGPYNNGNIQRYSVKLLISSVYILHTSISNNKDVMRNIFLLLTEIREHDSIDIQIIFNYRMKIIVFFTKNTQLSILQLNTRTRILYSEHNLWASSLYIDILSLLKRKTFLQCCIQTSQSKHEGY